MSTAPLKALFCACLLLASLPARSNPIKPSDPTVHDWAWRFYDDKDGIPERMRAIEFDSQGNMWLAGRGGLARYDGLTVTPITPANLQKEEAYFTIKRTSDQSIWVGLEHSGAARFDGTKWHFYTHELPGLTVLAITEASDGSIWVGCGKRTWQSADTKGGLARWHQNEWQTIPEFSDDYITDIYEDKTGKIWVSSDHRITFYDGKKWTTHVWINRSVKDRNRQIWRTTTTTDTFYIKGNNAIFQGQDGAMWFGLGASIMRYQHEKWTRYDMSETFPGIRSIGQTSDGTIWAYGAPYLYRFIDDQWQLCPIPLPGPGEVESGDYRMHITPDDIIWLAGLRITRLDYSNQKWASYMHLAGPDHQDPLGRLWFKHQHNGTVRFDGNAWEHFPNVYIPVYQASDGTIWSGGPNGLQTIRNNVPTFYPSFLDTVITISPTINQTRWISGRKDQKGHIVKITNNNMNHPETFDSKTWGFEMTPMKVVLDTLRGHTWFAPKLGRHMNGYGVLQYDGQQWVHHAMLSATTQPAENELIGARVYDIAVGPKGDVWVGTLNGLWVFDGTAWRLADNPAGPGTRKVVRLLFDSAGTLWAACAQRNNIVGGLFKFKDNQWTTFTTQEGLVDNELWALLESQNGDVWIGTFKGASHLSQHGISNIRKSNGLHGELVNLMHQDASGAFWYSNNRTNGINDGWVTRYTPDKTPPQTVLTFVPGTEIPTGNLIFEWRGQDPWKDTPSTALRYSWQLDDQPWSTFTSEVRRPFFNQTSGHHVFRVRTIDQDGNIDPTPATYQFYVPPPVWLQEWFIALVLSFLIVTGVQARRIIVRTRERDRAREELLSEMSSELQTARDLQLGLMPTHPPSISGVDLAGQCVPASHVGGDYFQYFTRSDQLVLALADVTGHAMEAAIPVVMFSGILENQIVLDGRLENVYQNLNDLLCRRLPSQRTFVCFVMAEIDLSSHHMRLANGACPCPYHYSAQTGQVEELETAAYPLGINRNTEYEVIQRQLAPGDYVVFCSDGIVEAINPNEEPFGFDRLESAIQEICQTQHSATAVIDHILKQVAVFAQGEDHPDDMTCMVMYLEP